MTGESLKTRIQHELHDAMRAHDKLRAGTLRMVLTAVTNAEVAGEEARELSDEEVLAGHTHGGQLCLPGFGALVTNCDLDRSRAKGLSRWWAGAGSNPDSGTGGEHSLRGRALPSSAAPDDAAWLHVSAGLGTSRFAPVRFACRPEATLLTLTARAD